MADTQLTDVEKNTLRVALLDYRLETERYLSSYQPGAVSGHDACCETARVRAADLERQRQALQQRLDAILAVGRKLEVCDPERVRHLGPMKHMPGTDSLEQCGTCREAVGK